MTQFSGEGGARYFDPKEARKRIHKEDSNLLFVDYGKRKELEQDYFIAIRSNYLPLRVLRRDFCQADLEDGLRYSRLCTLSKLVSRAWLSNIAPNVKKFLSEDYKKWWANIHGDYFDENFESLISMKPIVRAKNNDQDEGVNLPVNDDQDAQIVKMTESLEANKRKSASHPFEESSINRYWKRPKRDPKTSKQTDADGDEIGSNPTEVFAKNVIS
ncbi:hypothetical protein CDL12_24655 [Handroanthus impetiginosus]|uniref:Uncharacterized protein n=1 Tax=Handroanthus impetiginosus TaxID=429701 RepID=A0A2G9GC18_9LAMI|nr:hypothetical protein CDL12_24655 [Handroanthus impetiginosus]